MALILAAAASGKTCFVRSIVAGRPPVDGDDLIHVPVDRQDPADWGASLRMQHIRCFCEHASRLGAVCVGFSEVHDPSFRFRLPTMVVEIDELQHQKQVEHRHKHLRSGCRPRSWQIYQRQREHLRHLASSHNLRVFFSFEESLQFVQARIEFMAPAMANEQVWDKLEENGFVVLHQFISPTNRQRLLSARRYLVEQGAKLSDQLYNLPVPEERPPHLDSTIEMFANPHLHSGRCCTRPAAESLLAFLKNLMRIPAGQNAHLFHDTLVTKTPAHNGQLHWHH